MAARIRALLRRAKPVDGRATDELVFGPLKIRPAEGRCAAGRL